MNVLYMLTVLPPEMPESEALSQEVNLLRGQFGGEVLYINPNQQSRLYVPRLLFGFQALRKLRQQETDLDLYHFYNPDPYAFPVLRWLGRPTVYYITSGVGSRRPNIEFFRKMAVVAVPDQRSLSRLRQWGLDNGMLARPGIDTSRFTHHPMQLDKDFRLLVASAPWTRQQFRSKGIDALLAAAQQSPNLRLIFLWRGVLTAEMEQRVRHMGVERQVRVIDRRVNINEALAEVHATVALAEREGIVKSYPHSLLDSLAAGKPVLVSQAIPMADYVAESGCGGVVEVVSPAGILSAIDVLRERYDCARRAAEAMGQSDFSRTLMLESVQGIYMQALGRADPL